MTRFADHELDDVKARNPLDAVAGQYVKLRRAGGRLVGPCPICGGGAQSQRFEIKAGGESWVCAVCEDGGDVIRLVQLVEGCDFLAAVERLGGKRNLDVDAARKAFEEREAKRLKREAEAKTYRDAERARLYKQWKGAQRDLSGTPVERYFAERGMMLPDPCPGIRYLPSAAYFHGEELDERGQRSPIVLHRGPAMLAAFIRADGTFGGLHTTWLTADDHPQKLQLADPETGELLPAKKMRGSKTGAHIMVAFPDAVLDDPETPIRRLIIGEGIETVASVYNAMFRLGRDVGRAAFWAAGDLGNLAGRATETVAHPTLKRPDGKPQRVPGPYPDPDDAGLSIPDSVEELLLLGDGDSDTWLTHCGMERAARRYARDGRVIRIAFAPRGQDFNDVLRGQG